MPTVILRPTRPRGVNRTVAKNVVTQSVIDPQSAKPFTLDQERDSTKSRE